ncbi:MAG: hypothetical protein KGM24_09040 [Elusimicrobia bacterium]|nr:hypothetical protein [Elusimicrobiota bacterium]
MNTNPLRAVLDWMKSTDLVEVGYKKDGDGFALRAQDAPPEIPAGTLPAPRYVTVASEGVGVFQWSEPGKARKSEDGVDVAAGEPLGVVVAGAGAPKRVVAPCAGRIAKCLVDAGEAVDYGRPLFLLEPRA